MSSGDHRHAVTHLKTRPAEPQGGHLLEKCRGGGREPTTDLGELRATAGTWGQEGKSRPTEGPCRSQSSKGKGHQAQAPAAPSEER